MKARLQVSEEGGGGKVERRVKAMDEEGKW